MPDNSEKTVLIAPQHWGLGHVTRSIAVIRFFIQSGWKVILASSGAGSELLKKEFPDLKVFELPDYGILYPSNNMYWNMMIQMYKMHKAILLEHFEIKKICREHKVDLLVSDARLGAAQKSIPSVIITHHLHFPLQYKFLEWCADMWMRFFYVQFDQIWIPDFDGQNNLSGALAHQFKSSKHFYIGAISRFVKIDKAEEYDMCFMLSGPEPQRTYFENIILDQLPLLNFNKALLIRGTSSLPNLEAPSNLDIVPLATSQQINEYMCTSGIIICRSGYSTLLDLSVIRRKALLIPTPGQPEQEYLAKELFRKKLFYCVDQDDLDLAVHVPLALNLNGYSDLPQAIQLDDVLIPLIKKLIKN
ncbi:MAG: glycosyltransferase [Saprospiraceae bacterium]